MPKVNIGPLGISRLVDMTDAEAAQYNWGRGTLPERFKDSGPKLANGKPVRNEYEAYWAAQPPAVQVLMDLREPELTAKSHELADAGYTIDVPIMVWGWDPLATMIVRKNQGFTWVPSANQDPVQVGPGLNFPGLAPYDADHVPEGSIPVTIQWAKGFENSSPWLQGQKVELF